MSSKVATGRQLKEPQADHCIVEVAKNFVSAGGYTHKVSRLPKFLVEIYLHTKASVLSKTSLNTDGRAGQWDMDGSSPIFYQMELHGQVSNFEKKNCNRILCKKNWKGHVAPFDLKFLKIGILRAKDLNKKKMYSFYK